MLIPISAILSNSPLNKEAEFEQRNLGDKYLTHRGFIEELPVIDSSARRYRNSSGGAVVLMAQGSRWVLVPN